MASYSLKIKFSKFTWVVAGILLFSLILRWALILKGGQYYFSDEHRYDDSRLAADSLLKGQLVKGMADLLASPEHLGFKVAGIMPAILEHFLGPSLVMPAMFFSIFSVLSLYMIFCLSRRAGALMDEALVALFLSAASMSLLYYARHLMPYDLGMFFGLWALYVALAPQPNAKTSLLCGGLAFLCFSTYNGYWVLAGLAMLVHIFMKQETVIRYLSKALLTAMGFITPVLILALVAAGEGINLIYEYRKFAGTINQGSFDEGWKLPFEYFWYAEYTFAIILVLLSCYVFISMRKDKDRHWLVWALAVLLIYICLSIPSVLLHSFVVYGRVARQIMPFLVLLSAAGLVRLGREVSFQVVGIVALFILIQAVWNYQALYKFSYPRDFVLAVRSQFPAFEFSNKRLEFGGPILCKNNGYMIQNAKYFLEAPDNDPILPAHLLLSVPDASNFIPYLYEGYTADQRQKFQDLKIALRFYKIDEPFLSDQSIKNCYVNQNKK